MCARRVVLQFIAAAALLLAYPLPLGNVTSEPSDAGSAVPDGHCIQTGVACVAIYPEVTAETIESTICVSDYARKLRGEFSYQISKMKRQLLRAAGLSLEASRSKILDHIIPLELGGHPTHPSNLQLQDAAESHLKDVVENRLHVLVCDRRVRLDEARAAIAKDWQTALQQFDVRLADRREVP